MTGPVPAEWSPHRAIWVGFPSHADLWTDDLAAAQDEVADLARALAGPGRERVKLMVAGAEGESVARGKLGRETNIEIVPGTFGDVWLRDTGPIFRSSRTAAAFAFNGWGGSYELPGDEQVADQIASISGVQLERHRFVLEGGALDHDGQGTVLTTRQCLLNPNRNAGWSAAAAEAALGVALGVKRTIWLGEGLLNDHTDGHVDNLARFVGPGVVVCPMALGQADPNADVYDAAARALGEASDVAGRRLQLARIPSPGRLEIGGELAPASHMNFVIANGAVIVPLFGEAAGQLALAALRELFPDRDVIGLPSMALITGGGSFHCITQQEPA